MQTRMASGQCMAAGAGGGNNNDSGERGMRANERSGRRRGRFGGVLVAWLCAPPCEYTSNNLVFWWVLVWYIGEAGGGIMARFELKASSRYRIRQVEAKRSA